MSKSNSLIWAIALIAVCAATAAATVNAPDPSQKGPYAIGHTSFILYDPARSGVPDFQFRPIPVSVWYPVDPATIRDTTPEAVYPWDPLYNNSKTGELPSLTSTSSDWEPFGIDRAYEEPAASNRGPFPLVMFSPGWGAANFLHTSVGTRLASHGYVVAVLYHYGDAFWWWEPWDGLAAALYNRPRDVSFVLTNILERNAAPGDAFFGLIAPKKIAASGWSLGGYAAMTLAAGDDMVCDTVPPPESGLGDIPPWTCAPTAADARIKTILPLDGSNQCLHFNELARVTVPAIGIGEEWNAVWDWQARQHAAFSSHPAYRVDVFNTNHQSFSDVCEWAQVLAAKNMFPGLPENIMQNVCSGITPSTVVHPLAYKYMIAFLNTQLAGVPAYQDVLTPGWALAREQYAEFFRTEKRNANSISDDWPGLFVYFIHQAGSEQARAEKDPQALRAIPRMNLRR